ncbi:MAG TPA: hemolysin family protein [Spirochaetales bacterium]|nr:hemolysin family protein [Spirochaetales bacterium]HRY56410.1 hemolysin family protein [Spirochaetia bacterium]HRZ65400.1 hemolysin family protein [Spirochaetia bacterium]
MSASLSALLGRMLGRRGAGTRDGAPGGAPAGEDRAREELAASERREMIEGVKELSETTVREVLVPRIDAVFLPLDAGREELLEAVVSSGHSRIPVYRETIDEIVGVLYAKDLLRALVKGGDFALADILRKPYFVPESKRIDSLLREFRRRHVHIAIAVDEYGGVSGIVCLEDIIEEIVGEIQDEFDEEREDVVRLGEGAWLCDARADLEDLGREIGAELPSGEFETLGGYVFALFGKIPARYERVSAGGLDFTVQDIEGHRITSVKISRRPAPGGAAEGEE